MMSATTYHPEDVKAALRKRHGTLAEFARAREIKPQALADWFRGRTSAHVADLIAEELGVSEVCIAARQSMTMDDSATVGAPHRLNAAAR